MICTGEIGTFTFDRDGAASARVMRNKAIDDTATNASTAVAAKFAFLARWTGAVYSDWIGGAQLAMGAIGASLTKAKHDILHDAIEAYMDSNGKGVVT